MDMDQPEEQGLLSPEVLQMWQREAEIHTEFADEWRDYALLMATFQAGLTRAPRTSAACEGVDIEHLLIAELEHVANAVNAIFPRGGMLEFASYVTGAQKIDAATGLPYREGVWSEEEPTRPAANINGYKQPTLDFQPRKVAVGQGSLVMTSEDFVNGYQAGHLSYLLEARAVAMTDKALITLILGRLARKDQSERYNMGYVVGWIAALASKEKHS